MIALGLIFPLAGAEFDLSIGYIAGAAGMLSAWLVVSTNISVWLILLITLVGSALIGAINGLLIVVARIDSFIATLGTGSILLAFILAVSNDEEIPGLKAGFISIGTYQFHGISIEIFYVVVLTIVAWYVLEHTPFGRRLYAIGSNREAARLVGVNTKLIIWTTFIISAVAAGLAGIVVTAQVGSGSPELGPSYLLPVFAAAFLGTTQIRPGRVNALGTTLAVYVIGLGVLAIELEGAAAWVTSVFNGLALLLAVGIAVPRVTKGKRKLGSEWAVQLVRRGRRGSTSVEGAQSVGESDGADGSRVTIVAPLDEESGTVGSPPS